MHDGPGGRTLVPSSGIWSKMVATILLNCKKALKCWRIAAVGALNAWAALRAAHAWAKQMK